MLIISNQLSARNKIRPHLNYNQGSRVKRLRWKWAEASPTNRRSKFWLNRTLTSWLKSPLDLGSPNTTPLKTLGGTYLATSRWTRFKTSFQTPQCIKSIKNLWRWARLRQLNRRSSTRSLTLTLTWTPPQTKSTVITAAPIWCTKYHSLIWWAMLWLSLLKSR